MFYAMMDDLLEEVDAPAETGYLLAAGSQKAVVGRSSLVDERGV